MAGEVTLSELMQTLVITRTVNRIQTPLSLFQKFFGYMSGSTSATESIPGRHAGWDIYDSTRSFSGVRAPQSPPRRVKKKVVGHQTATLMRSHESIDILVEEIFRNRAIGGQVASMPVDMRGQNYVRRQIKTMTQRFRNQREWVFSRMLRGGFNILPSGDNYGLQEYDATPSDGSVPINFQIPAEHQDRLDMGTGSDIVDDWTDPTADVIGQCYKINKAFTRIHGRALKHIFIDSDIMSALMLNDGLIAGGGSAYRVFDSLTRREIKSEEGIPDSGFEVVFRAIPLFTFHVYDGVLSTDGETEGTAVADTTPLIAANHAIFLPEPDEDWVGLIDGSEIIAENVMAGGREIQGFGNWATAMIDPFGYDLKFLDNYLPILYVPTCVAYGDVGP